MDVTDADQVREVFESVKKEIPADEGNFWQETIALVSCSWIDQ